MRTIKRLNKSKKREDLAFEWAYALPVAEYSERFKELSREAEETFRKKIKDIQYVSTAFNMLDPWIDTEGYLEIQTLNLNDLEALTDEAIGQYKTEYFNEIGKLNFYERIADIVEEMFGEDEVLKGDDSRYDK